MADDMADGMCRCWIRDRARVEAGMLSINHIGFALPEVPFGGVKESGHGTEGGSEAPEGYFDTRFVTRKG